MSQRLKSRKVLITGAAGEIGKVLARRLLIDGCEKVILVGRGLEKLEQARKEILKDLPSHEQNLDVWQMDCSSAKSLESQVQKLQEKYGSLDGLVNNAGSAGAQFAVGEFPEKFEEGQEDITESAQGVLGTAWLTSLYLKKVLKNNAVIVNVSSIFSKTAYYARAPYVVPKAAMNQWSQCLARELGKSQLEIRVNSVLPGPVDTERIQRVFTTMDQRQFLPKGSTAAKIKSQMMHTKNDQDWLLKKSEIADSIAFLLSEEGTGFHAAELEVSRGLKTDTHDELELIGRPDMSCIDLSSIYFWINTGENVEDDFEMLQRLQLLGASGLVTSRHGQALGELKEKLSQVPYQKGMSWFFQFNELDHLTQEDSNQIKNHIEASNCRKLVVIRSADNVAKSFGNSLLELDPEKINQFIAHHIAQPINEADQIDKITRSLDNQLIDDTLFISLAESDRASEPNPFNEIAIEARRDLFRIWHHESLNQKSNGRRKNAVRLYQLISRQQNDSGSIHSVADWAAMFASGAYRHVDKRQIYLVNEVCSRIPTTGFDGFRSRDIKGLHSQRVAVITGGSEGIGGEISRQMVLSGAKIVIAERSSEKLNMIRNGMVAQCREMGYNDPEDRILLLPNTDVLNPEAVDQVIPKCLARFGRVDYVVNNVGLAGAERMVVDMSLEKWNQTQLGNVICNYHLIQRALPTMLNQGFGSLTLMSSYFGGYRHGIVPYTNRADYAVSKSAQMYLAEMMAPFIGPKVQINALAPGPVDGARLNGRQGFPGLYLRRSRLVIENKILNSLHQIAMEFHQNGLPVMDLIQALQKNRVSSLRAVTTFKSGVLNGLIRYFESREKRGFVVSDPKLLNQNLASLLYQRLSSSRLWPKGAPEAQFVACFNEDDQDFISETELELGAGEFLKRMKNQFSLQRMPTDRDLAFDVIWSLATRTYSGEVLYPSAGFRVDGERVWKSFCGTTAQALAPKMESGNDKSFSGRTIFVLAGSNPNYCRELAKEISQQRPAKLVFITFQNETGARLAEVFRREDSAAGEVMTYPNHRYDEAIHNATAKYGQPDFIFSLPIEIENKSFKEGTDFTVLPTLEQFKEVYHSSLTQHFMATKAGSHFPSCQTFLIGGHSHRETAIGSALHEFLLMSLRHLTLCAGKEASYTGLQTGVYQVDLAEGISGLRPYWQLAAQRLNVEEPAEVTKKAA